MCSQQEGCRPLPSLITTRRQPGRSRQRQIQLPRASAADVASLLVFSAVPFVAVQALADSPAGKKLVSGLEARKPALKAAAAAAEKDRRVERSRSRWFGPERPMWLGPLSSDPPAWLDGTLPGDYGYDPLNLGKYPSALDRYVELELLHARWAMLGALGALIPETLQLCGATEFLEPVWWKVGAAKLAMNEDLNYLGVAGLKVAGGQGVIIIAICQFFLMFGPGKRQLQSSIGLQYSITSRKGA